MAELLKRGFVTHEVGRHVRLLKKGAVSVGQDSFRKEQQRGRVKIRASAQHRQQLRAAVYVAAFDVGCGTPVSGRFERPALLQYLLVKLHPDKLVTNLRSREKRKGVVCIGVRQCFLKWVIGMAAKPSGLFETS